MIEIRQADAVRDAAPLAELARRCPMGDEIKVASLPGPRAAAWERFVVPRTILLAEIDGAAVGTISIGQRYTRTSGRSVRWSYLTDHLVLPQARDAGHVAALLLLEARKRESAAGSEFTAFVTPVGSRAVRRSPVARSQVLAELRVIFWHLRARPRVIPGLDVRRATLPDLPDIHRLVQRHAQDRCLAPECSFDDFMREWTLDPSLTLDDAVVVSRDGALVGFGALWDQRPLRREIVVARSRKLSFLAGLGRLASWMRGAPPFPAPGGELPLGWLRYFVGEDLPAAQAVRNAILGLARSRGLQSVMLALDQRDPLCAVDRGYPHINLASTLRIASLRPGAPTVGGLRDRPVLLDYSVA